MRPGAVRAVLVACLLAALFAAGAVFAAARPAGAQTRAAAPVRHVVIVGLSGLRWSDVSQAGTPTLWRLAGQGAVGNLVDYAVKPLTCPADGWLTLNAGTRAQSGHTNASCGVFPAVQPAGAGASVPGLPALISYNQQFHNNPDWGLLAGAASCATAVGPGAALALATPQGPAGHVASYLPSASSLSAAVLSRCPLTVVDLGIYAERAGVLASADAELARIVADLPPDTTLLVTAPGSVTKPPHLQLTLADGPGYQAGLLHASSTRQPGLVVLTDLTPTVLGWLGHPVPAGLVGAQLTSGPRGSLAAAVRSLTGQDTAEQVWRSTHDEFFWAYALADTVVLAAIGLAFWGAAEDKRRQRARWWRLAGVFAVSAPVSTFLANVLPWRQFAHPAAGLYAISVALTVVIALLALLATRRLDPLAPFGVVCLLTVVVLGLDVMTGSGLQMETPFGLSVLEAGRFYGIGNEALGIYGITGLFGAAWLGLRALRRDPPDRRRPVVGKPVLAVAVVAVFAVFASGWPGFGGKVGGTIAMVPCFLLLAAAVAGIRLNWRRIGLVAVSGLVLFAVFALISYFTPIAGKSDIGTFAGDVLHGHAGGLLLRKISSNIGSLSVSAFSPVLPVVVVLTGLMLWRPAWFAVKTVPRAFGAEPLLRPVLWVLWLMPVLGWLADDSGVIVPASALPLALPLGIAVLAAASCSDRLARYRGTTVAGPPVAGSTVRPG